MPEELKAKRRVAKAPSKKALGSQRPVLLLFSKRAAALLVDWLLVTIMFGALLLVVLGTESFRTEDGTYQISVPAVLYAAYLLGGWLWRGTTPGLLLFGLKVIDIDTRDKPLPWQWWIRALGLIIAAVPLGLGLLWALWDRRGRAWHDYIAGTEVVNA